MPRKTFASQIAELRLQFEAASAAEKQPIASALWSLCLGNRAAARVAVPWLRRLAQDKNEKLIWYGANALGRAGEAGRRVLRQLLEHPRQVVKCKAALGLADGVDTAPTTLKKLAGMLGSRSVDVRIAGLASLGRIARFSQRRGLLAAYSTEILAALDDRDGDVRSWAPDAVAGVFRSPKRFVEYALQRLDQPRARMRHELLSNLVEHLEDFERLDLRPYLPSILRIIRANPVYVTWFLQALAQAGPEAADIVPLIEPLAKGNSLEALRAGGALLRIDGRADVLEKLAKQLPKSPDEIAGILCNIGPAAAPVASALARVIDKSFDEPDWDLMWALTDALSAIESPTAVAVKALRKALSHESGRVKGSALNGLEKLGPAARAALPDLRRLMRELGAESRSHLQRVISAIEARAN